MKKRTTVRQALQAVADNPHMLDDDLLQKPTHELVARALFEISNQPDANTRGSMARANKARKMLLERLTGTRRPGSTPVSKARTTVEILDLTQPKEVQG